MALMFESVDRYASRTLRHAVVCHRALPRWPLPQYLKAGPAHRGFTECDCELRRYLLMLIDHRYAATFRFRDAPRAESRSFVKHLGPKHQFGRLMIVSGDRESEVRYLADQVGITEIRAQKSPEEKLDIVRQETAKAKTLYVGDGINDAPAMMAATVGMAIGQNSDVTAEAAGVVVMESSLKKVDEFMHISRRMRAIALQSAVGGMLLSVAEQKSDNYLLSYFACRDALADNRNAEPVPQAFRAVVSRNRDR